MELAPLADSWIPLDLRRERRLGIATIPSIQSDMLKSAKNIFSRQKSHVI